MKKSFLPGILFLLISLSLTAQDQDEISKASELSGLAGFEASNQLLDKFIEDHPTRLYDLADAWFIKSYNAMQLGDYSEALRANQISADLKTKLYVEDVALNYMREGSIYLLQGENERALNTLTIATEFPIEDPQEYALIYAYIASAYQELGNYPKALEQLTASLEILEFELGTEHPDYAVGTYDLGRLYTKMNQPAKADAAFSKAMEITKKSDNNPTLEAKILNAWGLVYMETQPEKAMALFQQSILEFNENTTALNLEAAITHLNLAKASINKYLLTLNNPEPSEYTGARVASMADFHADQAIAKITTREGNILHYQIYAEAQTIKALNFLVVETSDSSQLKTALSYCLDAQDHLFMQLDLLSSDAAKFTLLKDSHFIFETGLKVAMKLYEQTRDETYAWHAFSFCEQSKALVLRANQSLLVSPNQELLSLIKAVRESEAQLLLDPENITLNKKLYQRRTTFSRYLKLNPQISAFNDKLFPDQKRLKAQISENSAWLSYFVGKSAYYIFALNQTAFTATVLPINYSNDRAPAVIRLMSNLEINGKSRPGVYSQLKNEFKNIPLDKSAEGMLEAIKKMDKPLYIGYAHDLYNKLISPVETIIKGKESLVVSPDKQLFKIPFEAFLSKEVDVDSKVKFHKLKYLINDYSFEYVYSLSENFESIGKSNAHTDYSFLGMAPVFNQTTSSGLIKTETAYLFDTTFQADANIRSTLAKDLSFAPLEKSAVEVTQIGDLFTSKGKRSMVLLEGSATEQAFKKQSVQYNIIHLATHSFPHPQNGKLSGIAFYQPSARMMTTSDDDGILYGAEVPAIKLNTNLVVLSSCESSVGPFQQGDGPYSLARAFLEAGAGGVVSSLWKLYDSYSSEMMVVFYNELLNGKDTAKALKEAKSKMIKNKKTANPGIWSGLILIR